MSKIKANVFVTISGTPGSGKTMIHKALQIFMQTQADYSVTAINGMDREDPTIVFEDEFHRVILQTQQEEGGEIC